MIVLKWNRLNLAVHIMKRSSILHLKAYEIPLKPIYSENIMSFSKGLDVPERSIEGSSQEIKGIRKKN